MEITELNIKLLPKTVEGLLGFAEIVFSNCLVVRGVKITEGDNEPRVLMPSRKLLTQCRKCRTKNYSMANFCSQCGLKQNPKQNEFVDSGVRAKLYSEIAYPTTPECRQMIQDRVVAAYHEEVEKSKQPGYTSRYDAEFENTYQPADEIAGPLTLYIDSTRYSPQEIAEVIGVLSDIFETISGDRLVIDAQGMIEPSAKPTPVEV